MRSRGAHLAEMMGKPYRKDERAKCGGDQAADGRRQGWKEDAQESTADDEIEPAPDHVHDSGRLAHSGRRSERALKLIPAHSLNKVRHAIGEECSGKKISEIIIPRHRAPPLPLIY